MKTRPLFTIICLALALLALFAALPTGADHAIFSSDSTCGYDGASIANFSFDQVDSFGSWYLSWDTVPHWNHYWLQANGGGIFTVWTTMSPINFGTSAIGGESLFEMSALSQVAGQTLYFRVYVKCAGTTLFRGDFEHTPSAETSKD